MKFLAFDVINDNNRANKTRVKNKIIKSTLTKLIESCMFESSHRIELLSLGCNLIQKPLDYNKFCRKYKKREKKYTEELFQSLMPCKNNNNNNNSIEYIVVMAVRGDNHFHAWWRVMHFLSVYSNFEIILLNVLNAVWAQSVTL